MSLDNPYQPPITAKPHTGGSGRREFLRRVARAQRRTNLAALIYLGLLATNFFIQRAASGEAWGDMAVVLLTLPVIGFAMFAIHGLAATLSGRVVAIAYTVAVILPLIGLLVLILLSSQATRKLKKHGIRVGLMGADPDEI
ncbi:MAG: hypothetical protein AAF802_23480 [Planctomycetota bacterium]